MADASQAKRGPSRRRNRVAAARRRVLRAAEGPGRAFARLADDDRRVWDGSCSRGVRLQDPQARCECMETGQGQALADRPVRPFSLRRKPRDGQRQRRVSPGRRAFLRAEELIQEEADSVGAVGFCRRLQVFDGLERGEPRICGQGHQNRRQDALGDSRVQHRSQERGLSRDRLAWPEFDGSVPSPHLGVQFPRAWRILPGAQAGMGRDALWQRRADLARRVGRCRDQLRFRRHLRRRIHHAGAESDA